MSRSTKQPILYQNDLDIPEKYLRFSTPKEVAVYRAEKLRCSNLVEIGAGIGGQTFAFAKTCRRVLAIELDKTKANILIRNLKKLKIQNAEVITGSALSPNIVEKIKNFGPEVIFVDTERPEKAERTLGNIQPPISKILEIFPKITRKIAIEIPPLTKDTEKIKTGYDFEKEFISLNKQLNRLTLYFNDLKEYEISAVSLPSKEKIISGAKTVKNSNPITNYKYLYTIDPTIIRAGLLAELSREFDSPIIFLDKPVMLSNKKKESGFLTIHEILSICKNEQKEILECLKKLDAGKVILRYNIPPENYWKTRNSYENNLKGAKELNLFVDEKHNQAIIAGKTE